MKHVIIEPSGWEFFPEKRVFGVDYIDTICRPHVSVDEQIVVGKDGLLPECQFQVRVDERTGKASIIPGFSQSSKCLLFAGLSVRRKNEAVEFCRKMTKGKVLALAQSGPGSIPGLSVVAVLDPRQSLVFKRGKLFRLYSWNGRKIFEQEFGMTEFPFQF